MPKRRKILISEQRRTAMVPLISAAYCVICGVLGAVNAERSKGETVSMVWGIILSALGGFIINLWVLRIFLKDEAGWMIWLLYGATALGAAVTHFVGFFLVGIIRAAGNDPGT